MTIGILTHHTVINQGAIMQMYALQKWLQENGHTVYILQYNKAFDFAPNEAGKYNLSMRYIPFYLKEYVIKRGIGLSWFNVKKQLMYKKYISDIFQFKSYALDEMDAVIVGSDEVFSVAAGCNMMMYGHGVRTKRLISYAPSFGQTSMDRIRAFHCEALIASGLKMFQTLSVRDVPSAGIVHELTGIQPEIVSDPVMLYDFSGTHADIRRFRLQGKRYLLIYSMDRWMTDPSEIESIISYARKHALMTVSAGTYHKWCDRNIVCNPIEWLEIFRGAAEVITDTFHGALLSIITNRKCVFYIRALNRNKLYDLISSFGLCDRIASHLTLACIELIQSNAPDNTAVNQKLDALRRQSTAYLQNALQG